MVKLRSSDELEFEVPTRVARVSGFLSNILDDTGESCGVIPLPLLEGATLGAIVEYCAAHSGESQDSQEVEKLRLEEAVRSDKELSAEEVQKKLERLELDAKSPLELERELKSSDKKWAMGLELPLKYKVLAGASYLNMEGLVELMCQTLADLVKECETVDQIRDVFMVKNDFTPEEEAAIRAKNGWAFFE